jgi:outer membrane protein assembly factor BamB
MGQGDYLTPDARAAGQVVCVDLADFRVDWTLPLASSVLGAVVVAGDELVWGCSDGSLVVAGLDGRERRRFATGAALAASPAVTDERIYAVNFDGQLLALTRSNLELAWSLRIGPPGSYTGSPLVARGRVYVGTHEQGFLCVGEREENP